MPSSYRNVNLRGSFQRGYKLTSDSAQPLPRLFLRPLTMLIIKRETHILERLQAGSGLQGPALPGAAGRNGSIAKKG